ncbi:MAG: DUF2268 domain-containing putative Zn-dependent protease [Gemmatimonadales bacterium]
MAAIRETVGRVESLIQTGPVMIELVLGQDVLPFLGVGGTTVPDGTGAVVTFTYDPTNPRFRVDHVRRGLVHELHHAGRLGMPEWRLTLLELIVLEGLADHFVLEVSGGEVPPWSQALSEAELEAYMEQVKPIANVEFDDWTPEFNDDLYVPWFFGRPGEDPIPPWTGYSIGWTIVANYLRLHPDSKASTLVHVSADRIAEATPELRVAGERRR